MTKLVVFGLVLCVIAIPVGAQTTTGSIVGTVSDADSVSIIRGPYPQDRRGA